MKINLKYFGISDFFCIFAAENLRYYGTGTERFTIANTKQIR